MGRTEISVLRPGAVLVYLPGFTDYMIICVPSGSGPAMALFILLSNQLCVADNSSIVLCKIDSRQSYFSS